VSAGRDTVDDMRIAVVGGGISGLVAAYRLRMLLGAGAEIVVLDRAQRLGAQTGVIIPVGKGNIALTGLPCRICSKYTRRTSGRCITRH